MHDGKVVAGFAGSAADGIALFERLEGKLKEASGNLTRAAVELAKEWRTDRVLRRLEALHHRRRRRAHVPAHRHRRRHRARRRRRRHRLGRPLRARRGARAGRAHRARARARSPSARSRSPATSASTPTSNLTFEELLRHADQRDPRALTPRAIVEELDRYIVGQQAAKRAVAIALRNRWRRQQVAPELRDEIAPKNIIMIGPTGVGKTEIARRLAKLVAAPFLKVEASKFTEVGYVGRDVDSIVRDLVEISVKLVKDEEQAQGARARARGGRGAAARPPAAAAAGDAAAGRPADPAAGAMDDAAAAPTTRRRARSCARCCAPASSTIARSRSTSPSRSTAMFEVFSAPGMDQIGFDMGKLQSMFGGRGGGAAQAAQGQGPAGARAAHRAKRRGKLIDMDKVTDRGGLPRRELRHRLHRRDRQDRRLARGRRAAGPTCRARACSAICCRSSKARR